MIRMSGKYCRNDEARLGWLEEANCGDTCVLGEGHGRGRFHGTVAYRSLHPLVLERQVCLLADTTHKSKSYLLPPKWDHAHSIGNGLGKNNATSPCKPTCLKTQEILILTNKMRLPYETNGYSPESKEIQGGSEQLDSASSLLKRWVIKEVPAKNLQA